MEKQPPSNSMLQKLKAQDMFGQNFRMKLDAENNTI